VPDKGSAQATNDLMAGTVDSTFGGLLAPLPHIRAGRRPRAGGSARRAATRCCRTSPRWPNRPRGRSPHPALAGFEAASWQGLFAPAGLPRDILARLHTEVIKALEALEIRDFFGARGFHLVAGSTPEQFRSFIEAEVPKWARVVKAAKVTVDAAARNGPPFMPR
jgi:tripartite-type tricarboxylate transporter receptor subunit TctC